MIYIILIAQNLMEKINTNLNEIYEQQEIILFIFVYTISEC